MKITIEPYSGGTFTASNDAEHIGEVIKLFKGLLVSCGYRPKTVDGYVFRDDAQRSQVKTWIKDKTIPHLLFSGNAGIGKTTLAKLLFNELEVNDLDILEINASRTNSVDDVRDKIVNFVQMIPFGNFKVCLL